MAIVPVYCGAGLVKVNTGSGIASLGYSANGVDITEHTHWNDIHGDQNGGDEGSPIDIQFLGQQHTIRVDLTSYDEAVLDTLRALGGTAGTPITPGTLMFTESKAIRLIILTTSYPRNYPRAVVREAIDVNKGVKNSLPKLVFEAYKDGSGVLWNTTTS